MKTYKCCSVILIARKIPKILDEKAWRKLMKPKVINENVPKNVQKKPWNFYGVGLKKVLNEVDKIAIYVHIPCINWQEYFMNLMSVP